MRGLMLDDIAHVRLVKADHPDVVRFQRRLAGHITEQLDLKLLERQEERRRLAQLFPGCPVGELLDIDVLAARYARDVQPSTPRVCEWCTHRGADKFHPGDFVCWQGWYAGRRPRQLPSPQTCDAFDARGGRPARDTH